MFDMHMIIQNLQDKQTVFKMWQVYKGMIIFNIWWSLNFEMFNDLFKTQNWYNLKNSYTFVCVEMHDFWIEKILVDSKYFPIKKINKIR